MAADQLTELFERYLAKSANQKEKEALAALALDTDNDEKLKELISQSWELTGVEEDMSAAAAKQVLLRILHNQDTEISPAPTNGQGKPKIRRILLPYWRQVAVAASIVLIVGIAVWMFLMRPAGSESRQIVQKPDLPAPSMVKAMITLANGKQIALDSATNGLLAMQGDVQVVREANGDIRYEGKQPANVEVTYNTLFNPRGSKVAVITLADGTRVWLNSESSLRYFSGVGKEERKVELTGEAYFEVAKDPTRKFTVSANGVNTEVLGTHFNVNSYSDEPAARITLLEGSVKVTQGIASAVLKPGQQANVTSSIKVSPEADTDGAIAWKNGLFNFQDQPLQTVLRQVGRWYDISIVYEKDVPDITFFGAIESNVSLAQMLHVLERSGVRFTLDTQKKQLVIH